MPFDSLPAETTPECDEARYVREAMDLIRDKKNWIKGPLYCDGRHCMVGAVMRAMGTTDKELDRLNMGIGKGLSWIVDDRFPPKVRDALNEASKARSGRRFYFWNYNDRPTTHHEDVMAVMQAAYERLRWGAGK